MIPKIESQSLRSRLVGFAFILGTVALAATLATPLYVWLRKGFSDASPDYWAFIWSVLFAAFSLIGAQAYAAWRLWPEFWIWLGSATAIVIIAAKFAVPLGVALGLLVETSVPEAGK